MSGLGKEVERLNLAQGVSPGTELLQVPDLGSGVAGDVDNPGWPISEKLFEKIVPAALAGRVNHDRGPGSGK